MKLSYFHDHKRKDKRTLCFALPDYMGVRLMAVNFLFDKYSKPIIIATGVAKCHPKDNYKKSTGREIAFSNMLPVEYTIKNVYVDEKEVRVNMVDVLGKNQLTVLLKKEALTLKITNVYKVVDLDY